MEKEAAQRQQSPESKKGGRPVKRVKRSHIIVVRVTDTERLLFAGKAREAGLSVSAWFRASAKKAVVVARLRPEEAASLRMLSGLSNNLNQLTRLAHRKGLLTLQGKCRQLIYDIHHIRDVAVGAQLQPPALQRDGQVNGQKVVFGGLGFPAVEQDNDLDVHTTPPFMLKINIQTKAAQDVKYLYILFIAS